MTLQQPEPTSSTTTAGTTDAASAFQASWTEIRGHAVEVLTRACRLRYARTYSDGTTGPAEPIDFADFLACVLAAVAANVGSTGRLTAGRPGSWEAELVAQLVTGTVGHDEAWLYEHRTEPVEVPLNVPALVWEHPGFPDAEAALEDALEPFYAATDPAHASGWTDEQWDQLEAARDATERALYDAYSALYRQYATDFTTAVVAAAAQVPGLSVPVSVTAMHDPDAPLEKTARVTNPGDHPAGALLDDGLAERLWFAAASAVPTPAVPTVTLPGLPGWLARGTGAPSGEERDR